MTIKLQLRKAVKRLEYSYSKNFFELRYVCFKVNPNKIKISPVWQICLKVFAGACLFAFQTKTFAQNNWTGATGTDWATAENWSTSLVPTATDNVIIPATANQPVISAAGSVAKTVEVRSGALLTIQSTGTLAVNGSKVISSFATAFYNNGRVENSGQLLIGNVSSVGLCGIRNFATFNNNTGGQISIDRSTAAGLYNNAGTFTNAGTITMGAVQGVGDYGLYNFAPFTNNTGGQISIDRTTRHGLFNGAGTFTNAATITIGAVASVGEEGLFNDATFNNNTGGQISIDNSTLEGLVNAGPFTNAATITIGAVASVGNYGLATFATFNNNTGGQISIDNSTGKGLLNTGPFTNAATITIGAVASVGSYGLSNSATFNNSGCAALLRVVSDNIISGGSGFSNSGTVIENATDNSDIGTNTGIVQNLNGGTFTITNNTGVLTTAPLAQTWTGCINTDWTESRNWQNQRIPTATDNVIIPATANQPVISAAGAVAKTVEVRSGALLTIQSTGTLAVNGSKVISSFATAFYNNGRVENSGRLLIGNVSSVGLCGIRNFATFNNNTGGQISIDRSTAAGLYNNAGTFTNAGTITMGAVQGVGDYGLYNFAPFTNNTGGQISIDRTTRHGLFNGAGTFTNAATITIGAVASVGEEGLFNDATFNNNTGGQISIDNSTLEGLVNAGPFTNAATITIGAVASVGNYGLATFATFNNNTGGQISIDNSTGKGLLNTGPFTNAATITIGAVASVGSYGLSNSATFNNSGCAVLNLFAAIDNSGSFTNAAMFTVNTIQPHNNTALTNNGVISYPQGNAIPNVTNNALIAFPASSTCGPVISPALQIAAGNNFVVGTTWYQDAALSTVAGTYTPNTFTATDLAVGSSQTVYFTVNDPVNGCTRTVSLYVTLNGKWYKDADGDGYSDGTVQLVCDRPTGYKLGSELTAMSVDCNDDDLAINPGATEVCDGIDNNCDGSIDEGFTNTDGDALADCADPDDDNDGVLDGQDCAPLDATTWRTGNFYADGDGDGYTVGSATSICYGVNIPSGYSATSSGSDCNDANPSVHATQTWYLDADNDGHYLSSQSSCGSPETGYNTTATQSGDCNDNDNSKWQSASLYVDGDGDGYTVGPVTSICYGANIPSGYSATSSGSDCNDANPSVHATQTWYLDADNDGHYLSSQSSCGSPGTGYNTTATQSGDCNDNDNSKWQIASLYVDGDGDGYTVGSATSICYGANIPSGYSATSLGSDCNDANPSVHATQTWYRDADNDGYYVSSQTSCGSPGVGYNQTATTLGDCDDSDNTRWQSATLYRDNDNDNYNNGTATICYGTTIPVGYKSSTLGADCNDNNANIHPGAIEICDGIDNNCNGQIDEGVPGVIYYRDKDGDGYGNPAMTTTASCGAAIPRGYVSNSTDCNDNNAAVRPGAPEICDGLDNNCNGQIDEGVKTTYYRDADNDGYGNSLVTTQACTKPSGYVANNTDCNDAGAGVHPGATEICGNGVDDNCNGQTDENCGSTCSNATNLTTTNITSGSATLSWVAAVNPVAWDVQYKLVSAKKWQSVSPVPAPSARSVIITGLASGQTYNWRIAAKCGKTFTSYLDAPGFRTLTVLARGINAEPVPSNVEEKPAVLKLYPNPSNGQFMVDLNLAEKINGTAKLQLIDLTGRTVYVGSAVINNGVLQKKVSISSLLSSGIYTVEIIANGKTYFSKLIYGK